LHRYSVARGMQYLHSRQPPILHLDLKSPNILVDDKWRGCTTTS
jgi:serine/threonine protein kinase